MIEIQAEINKLYAKAIKRINSDFKEGKKLSFHHYAVKFGLNAERLQKEFGEKYREKI